MKNMPIFVHEQFRYRSGQYCGVMKLLADMPPCLGGGDNRTNEV